MPEYSPWFGFLPANRVEIHLPESGGDAAHFASAPAASLIPSEPSSALSVSDILTAIDLKTPEDPTPLSEAAWETIAADLAHCTRCRLHAGRTTIVLGEGNRQAKLMFVGEGPGEQEDRTGRPFVGPAGQLLDKMIQAMGYARSEVFIANVIKCRPPKNRNPEPDEIATCSPFLERQIRLIQPQIIVALGKFATQTLTGQSTGILRLRGNWFDWHGIPLMPTFHPSYLLRNAAAKREAWEDLKKVMARLTVSGES